MPEILIDNALDLKAKIQVATKKVENFLAAHFSGHPQLHPELLKSMQYSLMQKAAKRFRASLTLLTAEAIGAPADRVVAFAAALECVHTYSLIHDDLPSMDNDDFRRGEPTNHKVFGEATALLAGDGLLTEAFAILAKYYSAEPTQALALVYELSAAAGMLGMISGQMRDLMSAKHPIKELEQLRLMHQQKTGALISVSMMGPAKLLLLDAQKTAELKKFANALGLAFQVKDDLLDHEEDRGASYTGFLGYEAAKAFLQTLTDECYEALSTWDQKAEALRQMARYNLEREN
jgi:geranylgeranyl diphosphate synthase type II